MYIYMYVSIHVVQTVAESRTRELFLQDKARCTYDTMTPSPVIAVELTVNIIIIIVNSCNVVLSSLVGHVSSF